MKGKLIQQGAEANIVLFNFDVIGNRVDKNRIAKKYRHPELDSKLRRTRTKAEAKILNKLYNVINVPKVYEFNEMDSIEMEYIDGEKLSDNLEKLDYKKIAEMIGNTIAKIHDNDIIHGDLTTSNMILKDDKVFFIDFGLAFHSHKIEDKAVDLHLLKHALEARHFLIAEECIKIILENYKPERYKDILLQLKKVESRGRYKDRY